VGELYTRVVKILDVRFDGVKFGCDVWGVRFGCDVLDMMFDGTIHQPSASEYVTAVIVINK
jgi:hypothetical protein